jgi:intracellular sulfur oxidation DsrE/DsrF family protein
MSDSKLQFLSTDTIVTTRGHNRRTSTEAFIRQGGHQDLINDLKTNVKRDTTTTQQESKLAGLKKLGHVTRDRRAARKIARNKNTITGLLDSIKRQPRFGKLVGYSVECLKNLAVDEVSIEEMIDEGALETLMTVVKLNPYNEGLMLAVNNAIASFAINPYIAEMMTKRMGVDALVFSLRKHVESDTLVSTCTAMKRLMCEDTNIDMLVQEGSIDALAHVVRSNPTHQNVLAAAAEVVGRIADKPEYAQQLVDSGVVEGLLAAMKANPNDAHLAKLGANMIAKLAANADPSIAEYLKKIGAVDVLVALLEAHPENQELLDVGAAALKHLTDSRDVDSALDNITDSKADNMAESRLAMATLASLSLVTENIDIIFSAGGAKKVVDAIMFACAHKDMEQAARTIASGCRALMRLANNEQNIYAIFQAGGVKALIKAIDGNQENAELCAAALGALARMTTRKENADYIARCGGIAACLALLKMHPTSSAVAKYAMELMQAMAAHDDTLADMVKNGAIGAIIEVIRNHIDDPALVKSAINALGRCANSAENLRKIVEDGGLEALIDVLNEHYTNAEVAKQALALLEMAAMLPENVDLLRKLGAMDAILQAMEAHPNDAEVQEMGARALGLIAGEDQMAVSIERVNELIGRFRTSPGQATFILRDLGPAVRLLTNLSLLPNNATFLIQSGGLDALIGAFEATAKMSPSDERDNLMAASVQGIYRLAQTDDKRMMIMQSGAFNQMLMLAKASPDNDALAENVMLLARRLAESGDCATFMLQNNNLADFIAVVKAHPLNDQVLSAAVQLLSNLAVDENAAREVIRGGGADVLVEAVYACMDSVEDLLSVLQAIPKFAVDEETAKALVLAGSIDAILDAMRNHPFEPAIIQACITALSSLLKYPPSCSEIGEKGGLPLLLRALRDHYADEGIIQTDLQLLERLASGCPANITVLLDEDLETITLVEWAAGTYIDNADIQEAAQKLLDLLTGQPIAEYPVPIDISPHALTAEQMAELLQILTDPQATEAQVIEVLGRLGLACLDPEQAAILVTQDGVSIIAQVLTNNRDNEAIFNAAAVALQNLATTKGEHVLTLLQAPGLLSAAVEMIRPHEQFDGKVSEEEMVRALALLGKLSKGVAVDQILAAGALDPLVQFLTRSDQPDLMTAAAKVLAKLSNNEAAALALSKLVDLRALIQAMRDHMHLPDFLKYAVYLLANLAINDQMKNQIGIEGGIQVIVQVMQTHSSLKGVCENCCYALGNLSFECEVNISFIVACKGVEEVIRCMETYPTALDLLESSLCAINNLCFENDNNKKKIVEVGGARAVVSCMLDNINEHEILLAAFRAIGNLAFYAPNVNIVIDEGGVQSIVAAMTVHSQNMEIIDMAIRVLSNLASDVDDAHMQVMAHEGAVQAIVDVALAHTANADIEVGALGCLCNFARDPKNAAMIVRQGGLNAIVAAMETLIFDQELEENAVRLVHCLAQYHTNVEAILNGGVVPRVVAACQQYPNAPAIVGPALSSIGKLAYLKQYAEIAARLGAIVPAVAVLHDHQDNTTLLMECFHALSSLCRSEQNAAQMSEDVMRSLANVLTVHMGNMPFTFNAMTFLSNLCVTPAAAGGCIASDIVPVTCNVVASSLNDIPVLMRTIQAFQNLAISTNEVKHHLRGKSVINVMNDVKVHHNGKDEITNAAQRVIDAINRLIADSNYSANSLPVLSRPVSVLEEKVLELPESVRNLLVDGALLTKHSNTAPPRARHVYLTPDLKELCWKDPKRQIKEDQKMKVYLIRAVEAGRCTPQLRRKKRFGGFNAKEECAFAVHGRERTIDLEASTEEEREMWMSSINTLIKWFRDLREHNRNF